MKDSRIAESLKWLISWVGRYELSVLLALALAGAGLWAFAEVADEVLEGETQSIDRYLLLALRTANDPSDPLGPRWVEELGRDITALGGAGILVFVTLATIGYLLLQAKHRSAIVVALAVVGAFAVSMGMKSWFERARPDLVAHGSHVYTASFPSGHAMMSAAVYLTLGALLARVHKQQHLKAYFLVLAIILSLAVGVSRVYLGVHWPTDILAGWVLGASWALLCWLVARFLQREGEIEPEGTGDEPAAADNLAP